MAISFSSVRKSKIETLPWSLYASWIFSGQPMQENDDYNADNAGAADFAHLFNLCHQRSLPHGKP